MSDALNIIGTGSYLPERRVDVRRAVDDLPGRERERVLAYRYETVCVEPELYPGDMGLVAARRALDQARIDPGDVRMVVFTSIHRHGHRRMWSPASWLQERLGCVNAVPFNVHQGCNAQLLLLDVAADVLKGRSDGNEAVLVVAADRFSGSAFDRFTSDYGIVYGDGAAAAVISASKRRGWRVRAVHSVSEPSLEGLHRDDRPVAETPEGLVAEHDMRASKRAFLTRHGGEALGELTRAAVASIRTALLPEGEKDGVRAVVYPNLGRPLLESSYFPELPGGADRSLWSFGATVGHLGTADQIAGLDTWTREAGPAPGERVLLIGAGAGFTWTGMLLEREHTSTGSPSQRKKERR
ncbi:ketoacyl-ACP synthase III family protein [Nocardiopsis sp. JB363]|uniref:ketoacyl-ACP synthase III family protein n=1 Tax=Nocardiopsis sp. JB363 TaxID=1434837 RepID=UPI00097AD088|nr:ketoacyl-ACP synthase III family protein [Nocardiopsis sp. JB363]SIO86681.1 3-oxoacyl-[acyl-carrier-protein] synthase, KASIII [Nocardiopsis sp. JB363]